MLNRRSFLKNSGAGIAAAATVKTLLPALVFAAKTQVKVKSEVRPFPLQVYHRMGFGPLGSDFESGSPFHFEKFVETQLFPREMDDEICEQKLREAKLPSLSKSLKDCWKDYKVAADDLKKKEDLKKTQKSMEGDLRQAPVRELEVATWIRALYSEKQLQELVVQFWHDHFSVNGWDWSISPTLIHYDRDVIRKHAFGNFRDLVQAVAKSPAMLLYLDNGLNQSANPNENFARELFELHTLGAENYLGTLDRKKVPGFSSGKSRGYVDGDVYEAARTFTGWREDSNQKDANNTGEFNYYETWHDRFQKIVLGHSIPEYQPPEKDGNDVITILAHHEGTAHAICKKLCARFVGDQPSETLVNKAKHVFLANIKAPDQLRKVLRTILLSSDFKQAGAVKLKRPFEYSVSLLRSQRRDAKFGFLPDFNFLNQLGGNGQRLFQWKTPDGYPDMKVRWMTASGLMSRFQFLNQLIDRNLVDLAEFQNIENPVEQIQKKILGYTHPGLQTILTDFLKNHQKADRKLFEPPAIKGAVLLALMSPELQWK